MTSDLVFKTGLPANLEAERLVLGMAMLGHPLYQLSAAIQTEDFSQEKHRKIYTAMLAVEEEGRPVDRVTVANELMRRGQLEAVDGLTYLVSLDNGLPEIANLDSYVNIIREKSTLRKLIFTAQGLIDRSLSGNESSSELLEQAERVIAALETGTHDTSFKSPIEIINGSGGFQEFMNPQKQRGLQTPFGRLNQVLNSGGFVGGQMILVGARPGDGKTALACQLAEHTASEGRGAALFSLEMPARSILRRIAAARAEIDMLRYSQGWADDEERKRLAETYTDLCDEQACRLWVDDSTGCTVPAMRTKLRKLTARHPIGMVLIDYIQLTQTSGRAERRHEQITEISRGIKLLAREFDIPVVALAQIRRETEQENRKPQLSDFRDSGSLEQDADIVIFPWKKTKEKLDVQEYEFIIAKQREGPVSDVPMLFKRRYAKFVEA